MTNNPKEAPTEIRKGRSAPFSMVPDWITVSSVSPSAKALYVTLQAHANQERGNGRVWPSVDTIAKLLGFSRRQSIVQYVRELQDLGAIDVETEATRTGKRNTYTVHELPPEGYAGLLSLQGFYAAQRAEQDRLEGERTLERPLGRTPERPRTKRTQPDESSRSTSSGGADAIDRSKLRPRQQSSSSKRSSSKNYARLEGRHLVGKPVPFVLQKITALWSKVVVELGGELPADAEFSGNGAPVARPQHPLGSQLKAIVAQHDADDITAEWLDDIIGQVRKHAAREAELQREAASA
jgi:hypothetical protein